MTDLKTTWAPWASVSVELGPQPSWIPTGPAWGEALWGVDVWGSILDPPWIDVTCAVESIDLDTGRQGALDPGEIGRGSVRLFDPRGAFGIAGEKTPVGSLLRVKAARPDGTGTVGLFWGRISDATAPADLVGPEVTLDASDALSAALSTDDRAPLEESTTSARIMELLDRASWPLERRQIEPDATRILAVDVTGNRLDAARAAAEAAGGVLWATGDGVIVYKSATSLLMPADPAPRALIASEPGAAQAAKLDLLEDVKAVRNVVDLTTAGDPALRVLLTDPTSKARFGECPDVRSGYLCADLADLQNRADYLLAAFSWPPERVEPVAVPVKDDLSAAIAGLRVGDVVQLRYTGADPWDRLQLVGAVAHRITPDAWDITLGCYDALSFMPSESLWGVGRWDEATWAEAPEE